MPTLSFIRHILIGRTTIIRLYSNASQAESRSRLVRLVLYACCFIFDMHTIESAVGYGFKVVLYGAYKAVESKPTPR